MKQLEDNKKQEEQKRDQEEEKHSSDLIPCKKVNWSN